MAKMNGIFCIEGEWANDLEDQSSIRPLVDFLVNSEKSNPPIYRRVATRESFTYFVRQWKDHKKYTIGYFPFHGEKGALCLGKERLNLAAHGKLLENSCDKTPYDLIGDIHGCLWDR